MEGFEVKTFAKCFLCSLSELEDLDLPDLVGAGLAWHGDVPGNLPPYHVHTVHTVHTVHSPDHVLRVVVVM